MQQSPGQVNDGSALPPSSDASAPSSQYYAKKIAPGQSSVSDASRPDVHKYGEPIGLTGCGQEINQGLPPEDPHVVYTFAHRENTQTNIGRGTIAQSAFIRRYGQPANSMGDFGAGCGIGGSFAGAGSMYGMGSMRPMNGMGSMYGMGSMRPMNGMGSMYGMGSMHPMNAMGSMYGMGGMGSMYGMGGMGSRSASLNGSMYGMGGSFAGAGSMYGMGSMRPMNGMGSMYGMGSMGSMYGMGGMNPAGSMYGMNAAPNMSGMGSMYGMQDMNTGNQSIGTMGMGNPSMGTMGMGYPSMGTMGMGNPSMGSMGMGNPSMGSMGMGNPSMGSMGPSGFSSMYHMQSEGQLPSGQRNGGSMYDASDSKGAPPPSNGSAQPAANTQGENPPALSRQALPPNQAQVASHANGNPSSGNGFVQASILLASSTGPQQPTVVADPAKPAVVLVAGEPCMINNTSVIPASAQMQESLTHLRNAEAYAALMHHTVSGHNTALLVAHGLGQDEVTMARQLVIATVSDILMRLESAATQNGARDYFDIQLYAGVLQSAKAVKDLVAGDAKGNSGELQIGIHPVFGPAPLSLKEHLIRSAKEGISAFTDIMSDASTLLSGSERPLLLVELVTKQVRSPQSQQSGAPEVVLASTVILVGCASRGDSSFFAQVQNEAVVPKVIGSHVLGGPCHTHAMLCLSSVCPPSVAKPAVNSLSTVTRITNAAPRSGSLNRFLLHTGNDVARLKQNPSTDPAILERMDRLLSNAHAIIKDPVNTLAAGCASGGPVSGASTGDPRGTAKGDNPIHVFASVASQTPPGVPPTVMVDFQGSRLTDVRTNASCVVNEVTPRQDGNSANAASRELGDLQAIFHSGSNTALLGTISPQHVNALGNQLLWASFKRVVASLLNSGNKVYQFVEVSLSMSLLMKDELVADLLEPSGGGKTSANRGLQKLLVAFSPLFGPTIYKTTSVKPPNEASLVSTVDAALYQVPQILQRYPGQHAMVFATAVIKGITQSDVFTSSLIAAAPTSPQVFIDILDDKAHRLASTDLFEYALGGPCYTLFMGDVIQGDPDAAGTIHLINRLNATPNRKVRSGSVKQFINFAEGNIRKCDADLASAQNEKDAVRIQKSKRSMQVFYTEYSNLLKDPINHDPKIYRKSDTGGAEGGAQPNAAAPRHSAPGGMPGDAASQNSQRQQSAIKQHTKSEGQPSSGSLRRKSSTSDANREPSSRSRGAPSTGDSKSDGVSRQPSSGALKRKSSTSDANREPSSRSRGAPSTGDSKSDGVTRQPSSGALKRKSSTSDANREPSSRSKGHSSSNKEKDKGKDKGASRSSSKSSMARTK